MANKEDMDKPQWLQDIPGKVEGFSDVNLDGLWEGIEERLDSDKKVIPLPFMKRYGKAVASAAAIITVAAAALAIFVLPNKSASSSINTIDVVSPVVAESGQNSVDTVNDDAANASNATNTNDPESIESQIQNSSYSSMSSAYVPSSRRTASSKGSNAAMSGDDNNVVSTQIANQSGNHTGSQVDKLGERQIEEVVVESRTTQPDNQTQTTTQNNSKSNQGNTQSNTQTDNRTYYTEADWLALERQQNRNERTRSSRLSLSAGGAFTDNNDKVMGGLADVFHASYDKDIYGGTAVQAITNDATLLSRAPASVEEFTSSAPGNDFDWNISSSIGALANWYPSSTLPVSISTGLMYTRLDGTNTDRSLHQNAGYIGIPVRVNYSFLSKNHIRLGASAGGRFDYCINTPELTDVNKFQKSAYVGLSADYMLTRRIGFRLGLGSDIYFVGEDNTKSLFKKTTPVGSASAAIVVALP